MNKNAVESILPIMKSIFVKVAKGMLEFKGILFWYLSIVLVSSCIFLISFPFPSANSILAASKSTPWGVFTSIFAHNNGEHYLINMVGLSISVMFFVSANSSLSSPSKLKYQKFFMIAAFAFAIASNIIWIILRPGASVGASGLVYGVMGIVTGSSLLNGMQVLKRKKLKTQSTHTIAVVLLNIILSIALVLLVFQSPRVFLNISEGVNIIAHSVSYILGLSFILPWYLIMNVSILE